MLVRCGGNVIEIGRRQIALVVTAALVLLVFSVYSVSLLRGSTGADPDWIHPTPIDHVLQRAVRDRHHGNAEQRQVDELDSPRQKDDTRRKTSKAATGQIERLMLMDLVPEI